MRVFLAAPFTSIYREDTGRIDSKFKKRLQKIVKLIMKKGHIVESAHLREKWGKNLMSPSEFTPLDLKLIKECDLVIAYVGDQPSGVFVELGWASAFKKKIIVLAEQPISRLSPLVQELGQITEAMILDFKDEKELLLKLGTLI